MLLGHTCTRGCRFCAVTTGNPRGAVDAREPEHVARAIAPARPPVRRPDDGRPRRPARRRRGARRHDRRGACTSASPDLLVETLVGDFGGRHRDVDVVVDGGPDVFAHNVEVPRRLHAVDSRRALQLRSVARRAPPREGARARARSRRARSWSASARPTTKCSRRCGSPRRRRRRRHDRAVPAPDAEARRGRPLRRRPRSSTSSSAEGLELGFAYVASGPLVRSSYHAAEAFLSTRLGRARAEAHGASGATSVLEALPLTRHDGHAHDGNLISPSALVRSR